MTATEQPKAGLSWPQDRQRVGTAMAIISFRIFAVDSLGTRFFFTVSAGKLRSGYNLHSDRLPASC